MTNDYQRENNELIEGFLERTFYSGWRQPDNERLANFRGLEIMMNYRCNLACKYCYVNRYGEELYPSESYADEEQLMKNLDMILAWILENDFKPKLEFFSGEALVQPIGYKALHKILDVVGGHVPLLVIPTNYTFLLDDKLTAKVEELLEKAAAVGTRIGLSASVEGKYMEQNRPFLANVDHDNTHMEDSTVWRWGYKGILDPRGDEYYDKLFAFQKKHGFGFHPMIYNEGIEKWIDNFLWFQKKFKEYDLPWWNLYLLEVRNVEWTIEQCREFSKFMKFLVAWIYNGPAKKKTGAWMEIVFTRRGFNILSNPLSRTGRGMGCSFQSDLYIRLGTLDLVPCHRTSYKQFVLGSYVVKDGRIDHFKVRNPELFIAGISTDAKNWPYCEQCMIRDLCSQGCQGAQVETTGDMYTPFPTMCRMEHAKIKGLVEGLIECNLLELVCNRISDEKAIQLRLVAEIIQNKEPKNKEVKKFEWI